MLHYTNERTCCDFARLAQRQGLRLSFRHTKEFYVLNLRSMMGFPAKVRCWRQPAVGEWIASKGLRYASSMTLCLEKRGTFRPR